ncbi:MAG: hypothetical protein ACR2NN_15135 [Bryobacteraceae bacterium]
MFRLPPRLLAGIVSAAAAIYFTNAIVQAHRTLTESTLTVSHDGEIPFRSTPLDKPVPAGFEPASSPAQFTDAAAFNGRFYLCGPAGLLGFDSNGPLVSQYRPGMELPPSPLVRMAVGLIAGSAGPQLWIATATEGLLAFDGHGFRQIRRKILALGS